jgi:FkbM family methyltransferase
MIMQKVGRSVARTVCHGYPLKSGSGTIANTRYFRRLTADADPHVIARLRSGSYVYAQLDDYVGRAAFFFGDLDPKVTWICDRILRPGDLVIDVGANIGIVTMQAAGLVGPTGHVHAVEPQRDLAAQISASAELNGYGNITVHELGLSDAPGEMTLTVPTDNCGAASVVGGHVDGRAVTIRLERAGEFLRAIGAQDARLMKLDVEGHEAAVLAGAEEVLASAGPDVILFEEFREPPLQQRSLQLVQAAGYQVFAIPKGKLRLRLRPIEQSPPGAHDFLAVRRGERGDEVLRRLQINRAAS